MGDRENVRPPLRNEIQATDGGFVFFQQVSRILNKMRWPFRGNDYAEFENDGTLRFFGEATTWKDINFDVGALGQGASGPTFSALSGGTILHPLFLNSRVTAISGAMEIDHDVRLLAIKPHLHWVATTTGTGNVKFNLTYTLTNGGNTEPAETTISLTDAADGTLNKNYSVGFPDIDVSGTTPGCQFSFRLYRDPADAADTYAADVALKTFGIHVEIQSLGTRDVISD